MQGKFNTFVDSFEILLDIAAKEREAIEQEWHEKDMWYVLKLEKFNVVFVEKGARK